MRVIRAMLSLLRQALLQETDDDHDDDNNSNKTKTTHVLFCTESCIPVVTLGEAARSILLDEVCVWEEKKKKGAHSAAASAASAIPVDHDRKEGIPNQPASSKTQQQQQQQQQHHQLNWNRSYIHSYNQNSPQCTRFDEHNCWAVLSNSIPLSAIHKALPGWCLLSRKHAQSILELTEKQLDGMNLWPAFERVWAPEEVYFPTALALCGYMDDDDTTNNEVSKRSVTYSEWDTRASNHKDRAHPLSYDDNFDYELVRRVRNENNGALFLRKMKKELDLNVWEEIVVRRGKGCSSSSSSSSSSGGGRKRAAATAAVSSSTMRTGRDDYNRDRDRGRSDYRERNDNRHHHYDSRRNQRYGNDGHDRDRRDRRDRTPSYYDNGSSSKRQRWR